MAQNTGNDSTQRTNVVMGVNKRPAIDSRKRLLVMVSALLVAGVVLGGTGYYFYHPSSTAKKQPVQHSSNPTQQVAGQTSAASYQAQEQSLQSQLASEQDAPSKLLTYSQQSTLAVQDKQYADAQKYAAAAMQLDPKSPTPYADLAEIAQAQGNTAAAKQYWQEAIDHVTSDMPGYNMIKEDYQSNLDSLQ